MSLRLHTSLPSLEGATEWINGRPELDDIRGNPVLVYFWAMSCHICKRNLPILRIWYETYEPKGLKMIAIHCPRMITDTDVNKVRAEVEGLGILEPCGIDNLHKVKKAFETELWPAYFLFDKLGKLKRRAVGNAGLSMLKPVINKMFE